VKARITPRGLEILKRLDRPVHDLHKRQFQHISQRRLKEALALLEEVRRQGTR
jgi:hypothetical protein